MVDKTNNSSAQGQQATQGLSAEQWQGLARLADMAGAIESAVRGPLGAPVTEVIQTVGEIDAEHNLPGLTRELIETLAALREAGLLKILRDNASLIVETIELLAPLSGKLVAQLREVPLDGLREELSEWQALYARLKALRAFFDSNVSNALTGQLVTVSEFWQKNNLEAALADLMTTVSRLHESGMLKRVREFADYIDASVGDINQPSIFADLVSFVDKTQLYRMSKLMEGLDQAMDDAGRDEPHLGGTGGLLHLLRDKQVQKGLRTLFILPVYLEQMQRH